jgi:hypothetical protein
MPEPPVPDDLAAFLARPNPAVIATLRPDGWPHNPRVALTVLAGDNWYAHVSLRGRVASLQPDENLGDIDRLSVHYGGRPYLNRTEGRVSAWIDVTSWHRWQV